MKKLASIVLACCFMLISCDNTETGKRDTSYMTDSVGRINGLHVVISSDLWNGPVGEKVREHFAALADGLPQQEPIFTISQMTPNTYDGFARTYRTFLHITLGEQDTVKLKKNSYAKPQIGAFIQGTSETSLISLIGQEQEKIVAAFKASEIKERQRRTRVSVKKIDSMQDRFGLKLTMPTAYRTAAASDDFYWFRKDLKDGTTNILVYEVPLKVIKTDSNVVGAIIKMRDSIGSGHLPVEDDGKFITEKAYAPYLFTTEIDGKFAYETKGTWEVKDAFMAGPFLNYAVRDEQNGRYLILEGFTSAPSMAKRDLQFELESILKTAKID